MDYRSQQLRHFIKICKNFKATKALRAMRKSYSIKALLHRLGKGVWRDKQTVSYDSSTIINPPAINSTERGRIVAAMEKYLFFRFVLHVFAKVLRWNLFVKY